MVTCHLGKLITSCSVCETIDFVQKSWFEFVYRDVLVDFFRTSFTLVLLCSILDGCVVVPKFFCLHSFPCSLHQYSFYPSSSSSPPSKSRLPLGVVGCFLQRVIPQARNQPGFYRSCYSPSNTVSSSQYFYPVPEITSRE